MRIAAKSGTAGRLREIALGFDFRVRRFTDFRVRRDASRS
jgi:hypothetical protein